MRAMAPKVADGDFDLKAFKVSPVAGLAQQHPYVMACAKQGPKDRGTNKTGSPGEESCHARPFQTN